MVGAAKAFKKFPVSKGIGFFVILRNLLIAIFVISFIVDIAGIWQETHQILPIIKDVGGRFANPLYNLGEHASEIAEGGFYQDVGNLFENFWNFVKNVWFFLEPFISLFIWYSLFRRIFKFFLGDIIPPFYIYSLTALFVLIIQWFYILAFTDLSMLAPFKAIWEIFKALVEAFG